jgi:hypothetical protein
VRTRRPTHHWTDHIVENTDYHKLRELRFIEVGSSRQLKG